MSERPLAEQWQEYADHGWLTADAFATRSDELTAVRAAARAGLGGGRVFDGHRNALELLLEHRPHDLDAGLRERLAAGGLRLGVWGADPGPRDGEPARLTDGGASITGVKTFCSGAGWLDLAVVLVRAAEGAPPTLPVLVDLRDAGAAAVDRTWFRAPALQESHSHRVVFDHAAVLATLGGAGTLSTEPWISGDALRSSAVWAGAADRLLEQLLAWTPPEAEAQAVLGRAGAITATIDAWLAAGVAGVERAHQDGSDPWPLIAALRLELTERLRALMRLVAEQAGSRGLVTDAALQQTRDGLDILLLQHRLGPVAAKLGARLAEEHPR